MTDTIDAVTAGQVVEQQLADQLLAQAKAQGVDLVGPGGLLNQITTKRVLETGLEAEMSEHRGYDKHDYAGRDSGDLAQRRPHQNSADSRSARCRSMSPGIPTPRSTRRSSESGSAG